MARSYSQLIAGQRYDSKNRHELLGQATQSVSCLAFGCALFSKASG